MKKKYYIFENSRTVEIDKNIVDLFERFQGLLTDSYVEILAIGNDFDDTVEQQILEREITASLIEELEVLCMIPEDFKKMFDEGILT